MHPRRSTGKIIKVSGPAVTASGMENAGIYNRVLVGNLGLMGEVIKLSGENAVLQIYEETSGLSLGEPVTDLGEPFMAELGPGLLSSIFDGIQRPLDALFREQGNFIDRGFAVQSLPRNIRWKFTPSVTSGTKVGPGDQIGIVQETGQIVHRVMVPPSRSGKVRRAEPGEFTVEEPVVELEDGGALFLMHKWPVRTPRPVREKHSPNLPFITGQRVFDMVFPIALGGTAIVPGGFGAGKTIVEQSLAKFARSDIIVYIGCGERGNEITEIIHEFPRLRDPKTGRSLMERTILLVNTSNMPVAAREASIFTGITLAEYYRDMGYHVAVMADSTSRWAEALREISSRLEEMPGEEGYPTYLSTRLTRYYERGGQASCLGGGNRTGSVTIVSAISPPGGDFSEPVSQSSVRISGAVWFLDSSLAHRRHFPALDWKRSYSLYTGILDSWFKEKVASDWPLLRKRLLEMLQKEEEILEVARLVGLDSLQEEQRIMLEVARLLREEYLCQSAFSESDAFCPLEKQYWLLKAMFAFYQFLSAFVQSGKSFEEAQEHPLFQDMLSLKEAPADGFKERVDGLLARMERERGNDRR